MTDSRSIDAAAFRAFERRGWQESADHYDAFFSALTSQTVDALLKAVDPRRPDASLLDVATGPGCVAMAAARRGFTTVKAVDFSDVMVQKARAASRERGLRIDVQEGDAEHLEDASESFDAVTMNFGLLHVSRPDAAVSEAHRVLKRGGRFGFTVWAEPRKSVGFALVLAAIDAFADKNVGVPEGPPFFYFSSPSNCVSTLAKCGFADGAVRELDIVWTMDSGEALFEAFWRGTARTGGLLKLQTAETRATVRASVIEGAEAYRADGRIRVPMCAVLAVGTKE